MQIFLSMNKNFRTVFLIFESEFIKFPHKKTAPKGGVFYLKLIFKA